MQHKIFCVREFIKTGSATAVQRVFHLRFNIQPPTRRAFVVGITNWSKQAVCVKAKAPVDHVYQRRTWDELKRVLSVAHASQPVERAENLEYRNQLFGVCWGAVYSSSHKDLRIESIFLKHAVCQGNDVSFHVYIKKTVWLFFNSKWCKSDNCLIIRTQLVPNVNYVWCCYRTVYSITVWSEMGESFPITTESQNELRREVECLSLWPLCHLTSRPCVAG